jgi:hypothetical protein
MIMSPRPPASSGGRGAGGAGDSSRTVSVTVFRSAETVRMEVLPAWRTALATSSLAISSANWTHSSSR